MVKPTLDKGHTRMANILWEYQTHDMRKPIVIPPLEHNQESQDYTVTISHDSNRPITGCSFYISPFTGTYLGTHSPNQDYERILWLANNYNDFGLSIEQEYVARGVIESYSSVSTNVRYARVIDLSRPEGADIFAGENLLMVSGAESGSQMLINNYDPVRKLINLNGSFFSDVTNDNYEIRINKKTFFKSRVGSSFSNPIALLNRGGIINRFEKVTFKIKLKIPQFAMSAGSFYFDLNMRYTSLDN